jgi:hypothetical protein
MMIIIIGLSGKRLLALAWRSLLLRRGVATIGV